MPLGSESASLTRRALAAVRAAGHTVAAPFAGPGAPIAAPRMQAGGYSPGAAILNAVTSFAAGARAQGNYRTELAKARSAAAYQQASTEHMQAETYKLQHPTAAATQDYTTSSGDVLKGLSPGEYSTAYAREHKPTEESVTYTVGGKTTTEPRSDARLHLAARNIDRLSQQGDDRTSSSAKLRALQMQEQQLDTEDQGLRADADARAQADTEGLMLKASAGDVGALRQLGLDGADFKNLPEGQKYANIRYQGQMHARTLQDHYRSDSARKNLARRAALGAEVGKYSGFEMAPAGGDDVMQLLRDWGAEPAAAP